MLEPRGHADMYGALLTEPVTGDGHAGVLFMHNEGWSTMCGHGIIAVTTIALERGLIDPGGDEIRFDTPAGRVVARANVVEGRDGRRVESVRFVNVPSFVFEAGLPVTVSGARCAWTSRSAARSTPSSTPRPPASRCCRHGCPSCARWACASRARWSACGRSVHPEDAGLSGIYGTIFTGPAQGGEAHLRNVTVFAEAEVDRSPCGTGTAAVMAVLSEMGLLVDEVPFVHESIVGTTFTGRVVGGYPRR
jgi:proline racemase